MKEWTIPIIRLSALAETADIEAGLDAADEYMTKPFEALELPERVAAIAWPAAPGSVEGARETSVSG